MKEKTCTTCNDVKSLEMFSIGKKNKDGLAYKCKECVSKYDVEYREKNREKVYLSSKNFRQSNPERAAKYQINYRAKNKTKTALHARVYRAVKSGLIIKPAHCEQCKGSGALNGHHDDYSKPLAVRWLCNLCHKQWHSINGEGLNGT